MTMTRFAIAGLVVAASAIPSHAQTSSAGVREVPSSERRLIPLSTKLRYTTMIILPDDEEILDVVCGDKEFWIVNAAHNIAHLKPAKEGAATNLNLITASGAIYSFLLTENGKAAADLKVYVTPDPDTAPKATRFYTAKEVAEMQAALTELRSSIESVARQSESSVADFRTQYPASLQFSYSVPAYGKPFFVKAIWQDGKNTYIKADAQELPALYEVTADGKPAMVNFRVDNGTYIVPKVLERGYLAIGKEKLEFREKGR